MNVTLFILEILILERNKLNKIIKKNRIDFCFENEFKRIQLNPMIRILRKLFLFWFLKKKKLIYINI